MPSTIERWKPGNLFTTSTAVTVGNRVLYGSNICRIIDELQFLCLVDGATYGFNNPRERDALYQGGYIRWQDTLVSEPLKKLIEQHPTSKYIRGFVRVELGSAPAKSKTPNTSKGWFEFIDSITKVVPPSAKPNQDNLEERLAAVRRTAAAVTAEARTLPDGMIDIEVNLAQEVSGSTSWVRTEYYSGSVTVPVNVAMRGNIAILRYILEHDLQDTLDHECGDSEDGEEDIHSRERMRISDSDREPRLREAGIEPSPPPVTLLNPYTTMTGAQITT